MDALDRFIENFAESLYAGDSLTSFFPVSDTVPTEVSYIYPDGSPEWISSSIVKVWRVDTVDAFFTLPQFEASLETALNIALSGSEQAAITVIRAGGGVDMTVYKPAWGESAPDLYEWMKGQGLDSSKEDFMVALGRPAMLSTTTAFDIRRYQTKLNVVTKRIVEHMRKHHGEGFRLETRSGSLYLVAEETSESELLCSAR